MLDVRIFFLCAFISHKMIIGAARNPTWDILLRHDLNNQESHLRFYKKLVCIIMSVPFSLGLLLCLKLSWLSAPGKKWLELSLSPGVVAQVCDPSMGELREPVGSSKSAWVAWWGPAYRQTSKKSRWAEALYPTCRGVGISNGRDPWVGMPAWATEALIPSPKISKQQQDRHSQHAVQPVSPRNLCAAQKEGLRKIISAAGPILETPFWWGQSFHEANSSFLRYIPGVQSNTVSSGMPEAIFCCYNQTTGGWIFPPTLIMQEEQSSLWEHTQKNLSWHRGVKWERAPHLPCNNLFFSLGRYTNPFGVGKLYGLITFESFTTSQHSNTGCWSLIHRFGKQTIVKWEESVESGMSLNSMEVFSFVSGET